MNITVYSDIGQIDGGDSIVNSTNDISETSESESNVTQYNTDDEIDAETTPISITPPSKPSKQKLKVLKASSLPLVVVLNV